MVAAKMVRATMRRARRTDRNWYRFMASVFRSSEEALAHEDHVVGQDRVAQPRIRFHLLAVRAGAGEAKPVEAAARGGTAALGDGLLHGHAALDAIRAGALGLAVDVIDRRL